MPIISRLHASPIVSRSADALAFRRAVAAALAGSALWLALLCCSSLPPDPQGSQAPHPQKLVARSSAPAVPAHPAAGRSISDF